jgi:hypothetical protein
MHRISSHLDRSLTPFVWLTSRVARTTCRSLRLDESRNLATLPHTKYPNSMHWQSMISLILPALGNSAATSSFTRLARWFSSLSRLPLDSRHQPPTPPAQSQTRPPETSCHAEMRV